MTKFTEDIIIGIECHVELNTNTKLFCGCKREEDPKEGPNTRTCPTCLGHPGSKPLPNKKVIEYATKLALALNFKLQPSVIFSRKSYFYPDMSKNFQITQFEEPLGVDGCIKIKDGKEIGLTRIHIEEDPASLTHPKGIGKSNSVLVDYNRSGNPLCEIVTEPEMHSPSDARDFMKKLINILNYLGVFNVNSCLIKADANISIKESGYTRVEIKNIGSFKEIERALNYEIERQKIATKENTKIIQETRGWDSENGITYFLRKKETEEDYGYIYDPDLISIPLKADFIEKLKNSLPELPTDKANRYIKDLKISKEDAFTIAGEKELALLYEKVIKEIDPLLAAKWLKKELIGAMSYNKFQFSDLKINEKHIIDLLKYVESKQITDPVAKKILEAVIVNPFDIQEHIKLNDLNAITDNTEIERFCKQAIKENEKAIIDYKSGNEKSLNYVVGQVMKKSKGKARPDVVSELLKKLIN